MLQDWFDASQYHTGKEMFMQRIGTRIKRSRHGNFHVDLDMLDNHGGIGIIMYDPEHSCSTWCDVNVMGQRIRMPQDIRDEINTTVKYGGDEKWLVGRGLDSEFDNGDGDSDHLTCFYFGDASDISEIPAFSLYPPVIRNIQRMSPTSSILEEEMTEMEKSTKAMWENDLYYSD
ncbi:MAG: hypothetical protein Q9177_003870 [Variospora cf. flavescens]